MKETTAATIVDNITFAAVMGGMMYWIYKMVEKFGRRPA